MSAVGLVLLALSQSIAAGNELNFSLSDPGGRHITEVRTNWFPGADDSLPNWWFERRSVDGRGRAVYRWTTAGACPAAAALLAGFTDIDVPRFVNPSDEGVFGIRTPVYRLEGTVYYAGGHIGRATLQTDTDTALARWIDSMLAALEPCWADHRPLRR